MSSRATSFNDPIREASTVGEKISETASQMKEKVSDLGRTAVDKLDENRDAAATELQTAATALHDKAESLPGGERVTSLAHATAEKLTSTANYLRDHDLNRMMADVEQLVKNNPGPSLLVAAAVGFLVARAFSSND